MATGLEIAGIVLAVISFLEHYEEGLQPFKDFKNYKEVMQKLFLDLNTQKALFRNTCERLFNGLVLPGTDLGSLLDNPGGSEWQDANLEKKLRKRLQNDYAHYMDLIKRTKIQLEQLRKSLGLAPHGTVRWNVIKKPNKQWTKFKQCLSKKEYEAWLQALDQDNRNLATLTDHNLGMERTRKQQRRLSRFYHKIEDNARGFHRALKFGWRNPSPEKSATKAASLACRSTQQNTHIFKRATMDL